MSGISFCDGALYRFDFGTDKSLLMDGFIQVNPDCHYNKETGYGWINKAGIYGIDRKLQTHWGVIL